MAPSSETQRAAGEAVPPAGTVTFAFTDIEGSTIRWERHPAAMQAAVRRHDVLVRAAIAAHGGYVFKTIGDAFCAAFARPEEALAAMLSAQHALAAEDFAPVDGIYVRAALHTGTADERDGDYFGPVVNRVARLLSIAHGGQVILSGVTRDLVLTALPPEAQLLDLGEHRLKDLARPERVYQLLAPGLPSEFPPLASLGADLHNLPAFLSPLIARESEVAEISALLGAHRLVTLTGSGGIGKTRVALQVAANRLGAVRDGVWLVELAPLGSGEYLAAAIATVLNFTLPPDGDPLEHLVGALAGKHALLVLDNCEHLLDPAARVAAAVLRGCPHVVVLATSRQGLGIAGEAAYRLQPLAAPSASESSSLTTAGAVRFPAIALFLERARAADNRFALTDQTAPVLADICRRLDGIPLAIELAAPRVKMLDLPQLRERLDERFRVLTGGGRDVMPRQQTLRALIDWSYELLDAREQALFRRLGIFVSDFSLEGATAIAAGEELDEFDIFDLLASLVDKSLVLADTGSGGTRFRLLESTAAYAREKLTAAGERDLVALRHLRHLRDGFVAARDLHEETGRSAELRLLLAADLDEVRAALDWALPRAHARDGGELLAAIGAMWANLGHAAEGMLRIDAFVPALAGEPAVLSRLWAAYSIISDYTGHRSRALEATAEAVRCARIAGDPILLAFTLGEFAFRAARKREFDDAAAALAEAEAIHESTRWLRLRLLEARAFLSWIRGDFDAAATAYERVRAEFRALGNPNAERSAMTNLAESEHARGQTRRAIALVEEMLPATREEARRVTLASLLTNLAGYHVAVDDVAAASDAAREALSELAPYDSENPFVVISMEHLALAFALSGDLERAAKLAGYAGDRYLVLGLEREFAERLTYARLNALLRERLLPDELEHLRSEGAALDAQTAIALALADAPADERGAPAE